MIEVTIFKSKYDNSTENKRSFESFLNFVEWLRELYQSEQLKPRNDEPVQIYHAPLISPSVYYEGSTRANDNVIKWSKWAALDIDDGTDPSTFMDMGYRMVIYNTSSSRHEKPKYRIVLPLTREIDADEFSHFWFAINEKIGNHCDAQTKDISRMYYIPGQYPDAYSFFKMVDGKVLNPDDIIHEFPKPRDKLYSFADGLSPKMKRDLMAHRMEGNTDIDYKWTSYMDCPFVNQDLVAEYLALTGEGWYSKLYSIMLSIAAKAISRQYPITPNEIEDLVREIDDMNGGWYKNRPIIKEANRAIEFALCNKGNMK